MIRYDDGKTYFRCGLELIEVFTVNKEVGKEAEALLEGQTRYFEENHGAYEQPRPKEGEV